MKTRIRPYSIISQRDLRALSRFSSVLAVILLLSTFALTPVPAVQAAAAVIETPVDNPIVDPPSDKPGVDPKDPGTNNGNSFSALSSGTESPNPLLGDRAAGTAVIGNSGAATYAISITVPPGTNGVGPKFSFVYNSQSQDNGIMGIHWQLKGLSTIERCPRTVEQDGIKGGINYDVDDRFCLDGARLMPVSTGTSGSTAYGSDGMQYRTEIDSGVKVISYDSAGYGPSYFKLWSKGGEVLEFGNTTDSKIEAVGKASVRVWALNKTQDANGNYLVVSYIEDTANGGYRPNRIDYTGNAGGGLTPNRSAQFFYEGRADSYPMYVGGSVIQNLQLLNSVKTYVGSTLVKDYRLVYQLGAFTGRSRLISITECAGDETCLPANAFGWQEGGQGFSSVSQWLQHGNTFIAGQAQYADLNGDGRADLILQSIDNKFWVSLSNGTGFTSPISWFQHGGTFTAGQAQYADLNGDGRADLIYQATDNKFWVSLSTGTGFGSPVSWLQHGGTFTAGQAQYADLNGDGRADLIYQATDNKFWVSLSTGTGFGSPVSWLQHGGTFTAGQAQYADLNGDGKADVIFQSNDNKFWVSLSIGSGFSSPVSWLQHGGPGELFVPGQAQYADLNGDGKADVIFQGNDNRFWVSLSTGSSLGSPAQWFQHGGSTFVAGQARYVDMNGDGKADLIFQNNNNQFWYTRSTGFSFVVPAMMQHGGTFVPGQAQYADLNGDGKADLIYQRSNNSFWVSLVAGPFPDLVTTINNGLGGQSTITYQPITAGAPLYTKHNTSDYPNHDFQQPLYVVSNLSVSDGMAGHTPYLYSYFYEGGKFNHEGRGWLGFRTIATVDQDVDTRTTVFLNQYGELNHANQTNNSFALTGSVDQIEIERSTGGAVFSIARNFYNIAAPYQSSNYPAIKRLDLTRVENFECVGVDTTCTASFRKTARNMAYEPVYGNPTRTFYEGDVALANDERDEITEWVVNEDTWLHRPKRQVLYSGNSQSGGVLMREKWLYYDDQIYGVLGARGLLTKEESNNGGAQGSGNNAAPVAAVNPVTTYGYHPTFGNRISVKDARGCQTTSVYETAYQTYPQTITNCLSQVAQQAHDAKFGVLLSATDLNNQVTSFQHDPFGRLTKVTGPLDGTSTWGTIFKFYVSWGTPGAQNVSTHRTEQHGTGNVLWSVDYFDGLGRTFAKLQEGPESSATGKNILSQTWYDSRNAVTDQWAPFLLNSNGNPAETPKVKLFYYDPLGRQTRVDYPDGSFAVSDHFAPDAVALTDQRGKNKLKYFDAYGQLVKVTEQNGSSYYVTTYTYDGAGSLLKVVNNEGHNTTMAYDQLGRKRAMCDPNMGTLPSLGSCSTGETRAWVYEYYPSGDLKSQKDAIGQKLFFEYDLLGRPTIKRKDSTSGNILVQWTYDTTQISPPPAGGDYPVGRLTQVHQPTPANPNVVTTKFAYDVMGQTLQSRRTLMGVDYNMFQSYDGLSRIASETLPDGETVSYVYNEAGWLRTATATSGQNYINDIQYNARGQKTSLTYGNNVVSSWTYEPNTFRLSTKTTSNGQQSLAYGYDPVGNVLTIAESAGFTASRTFTYDDLNRLATASGPFGANQTQQSCSYAYNSIGNLENKCGATLSYNGDPYHPSAVTQNSATGKSYTYDPNGNMLTRGTQSLAWDYDNRVKSITTGGQTTYHEYDYTGMRVKKDAPAGITLFPLTGYEKAPSGEITKYIRIGVETLASKKGANKYFYHNDHLGGVNIITDSIGNRCQLNEYDPWGGVSRSEGPTSGSQPTCEPTHRFTGQELDPESGLYYYGGRYYDAEVGRFVSPDPFVQEPDDPQNLNRYTYVMNNPQGYIDPSGYTSCTYNDADCSISMKISANSATPWDPFPDSTWANPWGSFTGWANPGISSTSSMGGDAGYPWYSNSSSFGGNSSFGWIGSAIEVFTYFPGPVGFVATGAQAGISAFRGDYVAAGVGVIAAAGTLVGVPSKVVTSAVKATSVARAAVSTAAIVGKGQIHHIATDKSIKSGFTAEFKKIFDRGGISLQDSANTMLLEGHCGRHCSAYHAQVLDRLSTAIRGLSGPNYQQALRTELEALRRELIANPGLVRGVGLK